MRKADVMNIGRGRLKMKRRGSERLRGDGKRGRVQGSS